MRVETRLVPVLREDRFETQVPLEAPHDLHDPIALELVGDDLAVEGDAGEHEVNVLAFPTPLVVVEVSGPWAALVTHLGPDALGDLKPLLFGQVLAVPRPYRNVDDGTGGLLGLVDQEKLTNDLALIWSIRIVRQDRRAQSPSFNRLSLAVLD